VRVVLVLSVEDSSRIGLVRQASFFLLPRGTNISSTLLTVEAVLLSERPSEEEVDLFSCGVRTGRRPASKFISMGRMLVSRRRGRLESRLMSSFRSESP
jgi:hypothetical protein